LLTKEPLLKFKLPTTLKIEPVAVIVLPPKLKVIFFPEGITRNEDNVTLSIKPRDNSSSSANKAFLISSSV
jgi:hypothetical protein